MDDSTFRDWAHRLADWMADYRENIGSRAVLPETGPGEIAAQLPQVPPPAGVGMDEIMARGMELPSLKAALSEL